MNERNREIEKKINHLDQIEGPSAPSHILIRYDESQTTGAPLESEEAARARLGIPADAELALDVVFDVIPNKKEEKYEDDDRCATSSGD